MDIDRCRIEEDYLLQLNSMKTSLFIVCLFSLHQVFGQSKRDLDFQAIESWKTVALPNSGAISKNGSYVSYFISEPNGNKTTVLKSSQGSWERQYHGISEICFTHDNRYAVFKNKNDSLQFVKLGTNEVMYIPSVDSYFPANNMKFKWLAYTLKGRPKSVYLFNYLTNSLKSFENVQMFQFCKNGNLFVCSYKASVSEPFCLTIMDIPLNLTKTIWKGENLHKIAVDEEGSKIAFILTKDHSNVLWFYSHKDGKFSKLVDDSKGLFESKLTIKDLDYSTFNKSTDRLYFSVTREDSHCPKTDSSHARLNIWSIHDVELQSTQRLRSASKAAYLSVVNLTDKTYYRLQYDGESIVRSNGNYSLIRWTSDISNSERTWNGFYKTKYFIQDEVSGIRTELPDSNITFGDNPFSPQGNYLVYYSVPQSSFISLNLHTKVFKNISNGLIPPMPSYMDTQDDSWNPFSTIAFWSKNESSAYVQGARDIWKLDIEGRNDPKNITNNFGLKNSILFKPYKKLLVDGVNTDDDIVLNAFNLRDKKSGFYKVYLDKCQDPTLLSMGDYVYNHSALYINELVKAYNSNSYLLLRESSTESANIYFTKDFKDFKRITFNEPEREYHYLTAELLTYFRLDHVKNQAILYKPANFNPNHKYPIIFNYYEKKSHKLNEFLPPGLLTNFSNINIPWFVSHGYIVCTPDIHFQEGDVKGSVLKSVLATVEELKKYKWIDTSAMGLQGYSFGGHETNLLVATTNIFAAAASGGAPANLITWYGATHQEQGVSLQSMVESCQIRIGSSLWQNPGRYFDESAIFKADQIETPILLLYGTEDL
jgi:dipeptidyl aminopeptidase/acylaminoacyl peptidase